MDENMRTNDGQELPADQVAEPVDQAAEPNDQAAEPVDQTAEANDQADVPAEQTDAPVAMDWRFGASAKAAEPPAKRKGIGGFFAVFGAVFGICVLLLIGVICLGDGSFQIIRKVQTERVVYVREDDGTSGLLTPNEAAQKVAASTVTIVVKTETASGNGSGFIYTADGYVITNHHVIKDATVVQVMLADGMTYDATVVGSNEDGDVAVLKIEATGLVPAQIGSSADLLVGDAVLAVGTPRSLAYAGTATFGTVSATDRLMPLVDENGNIEKKLTLIQTDVSINPGNSGGPLADMYGKVVGMVVRKVTVYDGVPYEGIGLALPIDGVKIIADEIIRTGSFTGDNPIAEGRSLLGLTGHGGVQGMWYADEANAAGVMEASETEKPGYHYMPVSGVYVMAVGGTNAAGKLYKGDIVTKLNGQNVYVTADLIEMVNRYHAGETVQLTVLRGGEQIIVEIVLLEERVV